MAEIIKPGGKQAGWTKEVVCKGMKGGKSCGATLIITEFDLYETQCGEYDTLFYPTFCCPQCGAETALEGSLSRSVICGKRPTIEERKAIAMKNL